MTVATLSEVLEPALRDGYAVAGLVVLGWEDARAYVAAAEAEGAPVILQAGPGCRRHMPLPALAPMLRHLAETAAVPVVVHLDHGYSREECVQAIEHGFSSVMYDGSANSLERNIVETAEIAALAHEAGVSCEGEIGVVGYSGGKASASTDPEQAARFARETGVDAMAISVGNVHLRARPSGGLEETRLRQIEALTNVPLVIHGGSGVPAEQRSRLARTSRICKYNIGTELRLVFGKALRDTLTAEPGLFDRIEILARLEPKIRESACAVIRSLGQV